MSNEEFAFLQSRQTCGLDLAITYTLISVFVKQCYTELLREAEKHPDNRLPLRVNFLLDEFSNLPAIADFPAMITASRSRNIRFNLFIQSQKQLVRRYGEDADTIKGNCENWVFLHSRELPLLNEIVDLSGMRNSDMPLISVSMRYTFGRGTSENLCLRRAKNAWRRFRARTAANGQRRLVRACYADLRRDQGT